MKKNIITTLLLFLILLLGSIPAVTFAADLTGAIYSGTIRVSNNNTSTVNVSGIVSINGTAWISTNLMTANASNIAITTGSGSDTIFMPGTSGQVWAVWAQDVPAGNSDYTIWNNVSGGKIRTFFNTSGMTIPDNDLLEPAGNATISISGRFDSTQAGDILNKPGALKITADGAGNINFTTPGSAGIVSANATGNHSVGETTFNLAMPSGLAAGDLLIAQIAGFNGGGAPVVYPAPDWTELWSGVAMAAGHEYAGFYKVASGTENSTSENFSLSGSSVYVYQVLMIDSTHYFGNPVAATAAVDAGASNPNPPNLTTGFGAVDTIWLALSAINPTIGSSAPAGYSGFVTNLDTVTTLGMSSAYKNSNAASENPGTFSPSETNWAAETIGVRSTSSLTASSVASGELNIQATANISSYGLYIDGTLKDSYAITGNITNSANNWTLFGSSVMPYLSGANITVNGTLAGGYDFTRYYNSTVIPDQSANSNNGTANYRTTSSDSKVTITLQNFGPVTEAQVDTDTAITWPTFADESNPPAAPATTFTENATPGIFFASDINAIWAATGMSLYLPVAMFWYMFAFFWIILIGVFVFYMFAEKGQQALLIKIVMMTAIMTMFALPGPNIFGLYVVVYFVMFSFGVLVVSKSYGW